MEKVKPVCFTHDQNVKFKLKKYIFQIKYQ